MEALSDHVPPPAPSGARAADTEQPRPSPEAAAEVPGEQGRGQQEDRGGEGRGHGSPLGPRWASRGVSQTSVRFRAGRPRMTAAFPSMLLCTTATFYCGRGRGRGRLCTWRLSPGLRWHGELVGHRVRGAGIRAGGTRPLLRVSCAVAKLGCAPCASGSPGAAVSGGHSSTSGRHAVLPRMKAHGRDAEGLLGCGALLSEHPGRGPWWGTGWETAAPA